MQIDLEKQDIQNIISLIGAATIKGQEASTVATIQAKLATALIQEVQIDKVIEK